jgi:hypothetical protein
MELYGLKDKDGKEYKVTLPYLEVFGSIDNRISIKPVESEPEFKVGDWVVAKEKYFRPYSPRLITSIGTDIYNAVQYNYFDDFNKTEKNGCYGKYLRHATPQEIEQHLRKICEEKYVGKRVKCLIDGATYIPYVLDKYDSFVDTLWYFDKQGTTIKIYGSGKFADIVPEKKKLPKTKEELMNFVLEDLHPFFYDSDLPKIMKIINDHEDT